MRCNQVSFQIICDWNSNLLFDGNLLRLSFLIKITNCEKTTQAQGSDKNDKIEDIKKVNIKLFKDVESSKQFSKSQKLIKKTSALEQQQNVLRQVAAARETSKNDKKIALNKTMEHSVSAASILLKIIISSDLMTPQKYFFAHSVI